LNCELILSEDFKFGFRICEQLVEFQLTIFFVLGLCSLEQFSLIWFLVADLATIAKIEA